MILTAYPPIAAPLVPVGKPQHANRFSPVMNPRFCPSLFVYLRDPNHKLNLTRRRSVVPIKNPLNCQIFDQLFSPRDVLLHAVRTRD